MSTCVSVFCHRLICVKLLIGIQVNALTINSRNNRRVNKNGQSKDTRATLGIQDTERRQTQQKHITENLKDEEHEFQQNDWGELIYFSINLRGRIMS